MTDRPNRPTRPALPAELLDTGVVAIARAATTEWFDAAADTLVAAGITCIEVTLTMPGAVSCIEKLAARLGSAACIGAGTVLTATQARACVDAGARFLVSPNVATEVIDAALADAIPCLPGALTPSEIVAAWTSGAAAVKLFPASLGGVEYLRDVRAPLPDVPLIPTGGVGLDHVADYLRAGAVAVGLGSPLFRDVLTGGDLGALAHRARELCDAVRDGRST
jgi:2-dehydro-3-deoxyphosphogluconate aldolase/(4S)-4-hydroxy-2-oxoglutarate aldolase